MTILSCRTTINKIHPNIVALIVSVITFTLFFYKLYSPIYWVYGSDTQIMHLPVRQYLYDVIYKEGMFPFWTEKAYGGFPMYKNPEYMYLNPINVLSILIFGPAFSYKIMLFMSYLVGSFSLWLFLRRKGFNIPGYFCANLIYYFSFFLINHQIHFNIILTVYLFPLVLLLQDKLIEKPNVRNTLYFSLLLSYLLYCGHPQTAFLIYLTVFIYFLYNIHSKMYIKSTLLTGFYSFLMVFLLTLPLNITTYDLAKNSVRNVDPVFSYTEGTYYPTLFANTVVPYLFKNFGDFTGRDELGREYTYTETYTYIGITSVLFSLFGLFLTKKNRLSYFSYSLILLFIFFASIGLLPFFNNIPIITLFRHWERSVFLANIGIGILVANYISNYSSKNIKYLFSKKNLILLLIPVLYLSLLSFIYSGSKINNVTLQHITDWYLIHSLWKRLFIFTIISFLLFNIKRLRYIAIVLTCLIILFDLTNYTRDVINTRIYGVSNPIPIVYIKGFDNKRIIDLTSNLKGMQFLNSNYYSIFGYSQLVNKNYREILGGYGYRGNVTDPNGSTILDNNLMQYFGVDGVLTNLGLISSSYVNSEYIYLTNNEQYKSIKTLTSNKETLTTIRCDDGWSVKVNGHNAITRCDYNGLFIKVITDGHPGTIIEFKYLPIKLYLCCLFSLLGSIFVVYSARYTYNNIQNV